MRGIFAMIWHPRLVRSPFVGLILVFLPVLSGCTPQLFRSSAPRPPRLLRLAAIFPARGADAPLGRALQRGVDLAVSRHIKPARGYRLVIVPVDETAAPARIDAILRKRQALAVVGPLESQDALALLPTIERLGIATITVATLPSVTRSLSGGKAGLSRGSLHPVARPVALFRPAPTGNAAGKAAADLAVAPAPGLAATTIFVVDDGSPAGTALATSFTDETRLKGASVAGQRTIAERIPDNVQEAVSAIIEAHPDLVFYAGGTAAGADLRRALSLTGAPQLRLLTAGTIADHPGWGAAVGTRAATAYTEGLLPAPGLSILPHARKFVYSYRHAFPGTVLLPQIAVAYDAAMDEIRAMQAVIREGKPVTRSSVRRVIASVKYRGITGTFAFNPDGDNARSIDLSLYACDVRGVWHYERTVEAR